MQFKLYTLDGKALLTHYKSNIKKEQSENPVLLEFVLKETIFRNEFALLHQIREEYKNIEHNSDNPLFDVNSTEFFLDKLILVDFSTCLSFFGEKSTEKLFNDGFKLKMSFKLQDNKTFEREVLFVPFEKSNSQARTNVISFINSELFYGCKERIDLGFSFGDYKGIDSNELTSLNVPSISLSKLYAYRGLMCSDATRIELLNPLLNEKNTVVIDDIIVDNYSKGKEKEQSKQVCITMPDPTAKNDTGAPISQIAIKEESVAPGNLFDGEGICSPLVAAHINYSILKNKLADIFSLLFSDSYEYRIQQMTKIYNQVSLNVSFNEIFDSFLKDNPLAEVDAIKSEYLLKKLIDNSSFSFQVRLPFAKGVLHTVNFHQFFEEHFINHETITDLYDINRDFNDVQIILTKSMFKMASLGYNSKNLAAAKIEDPMKAYFQRLNKYNHSLYLVQTEKRLQERTNHDMPTVNVSYQILNTLDLSDEDFNTLVDNHKAIIESYKEDKIKESIKEGHNLPGKVPFKTLLKENPELLGNIYFAEQLRDIRKDYYNKLLNGKLSVEGEKRFLSRDILFMLKDIADKNNFTPQFDGSKNDAHKEKDTYINIKKNQVPHGSVFAPGYKYIQKGEATIFRSPHLATNENVYTKLVNTRDENNNVDNCEILDKYFSHLKGVVFLAKTSTANLALSGADFDGDMVLLVNNPIIIKSCKKDKGGYNELDKEKSLPLVVIPSLSAHNFTTGQNSEPKYIDFKTIKQTFDSSVGIISNLCLKLAAIEYNLNKEKRESFFNDFNSIIKEVHPNYDETAPMSEITCKIDDKLDYSEYQSFVALCTIVVGLEIDSVKTGCKPRLEPLENLLNQYSSNKNANAVKTYLSLLDSVKSIGIKFAKGNSVTFLNNTYQQVSTNSSNSYISKLPKIWIDGIAQEYSKLNSTNCLFDNTEIDVSDEITKNVNKIFNAYNSVVSSISKINNSRKNIGKEEYTARSINLLREQYDSDVAILDFEYETLKLKLIEKLSDNVDNHIKKLFAIDNINDFWPYTEKETAKALLEEMLDINDNNSKETESLKLLTSFNTQGYLVLYYLMRELKSIETLNKELAKYYNLDPKKTAKNKYLQEYRKISCESIEKNTTNSYITNNILLPQCKSDLFEAFGVTNNNPDDETLRKIIRLTHKIISQKSKQELFFNLFTEEQLVKAFKEEGSEKNA